MTGLEMTQLRCVFVPFDWHGKAKPQAIELAPGERVVGIGEVGGQGPPTLRVWLASATTTALKPSSPDPDGGPSRAALLNLVEAAREFVAATSYFRQPREAQAAFEALAAALLALGEQRDGLEQGQSGEPSAVADGRSAGDSK